MECDKARAEYSFDSGPQGSVAWSRGQSSVAQSSRSGCKKPGRQTVVGRITSGSPGCPHPARPEISSGIIKGWAMSIEALMWAWAQRISHGSKLVLLALADHADEEGWCWPRVRYLAKKCGVSERSVQRGLKDLERSAFVQRIETFREDGSHGSNRYRVGIVPVPSVLSPPGVTVSPPGVTVSPPGDASVTPLNPHRTLKEPRTPTPAHAGLNGFDQFWAAYPKHRAKGDAEKAWKQVAPPLPQILSALVALRQSRDWQKDGGQFIPYPATWLRRKGWEDEVQAEHDGLYDAE